MSAPLPRKSDASEGDVANALIRSVMAEQKRVHSRNALPELEPVEPEDEAHETRLARKSRIPRSTPARMSESGSARFSADAIRRYRPKRSHIILACLVLVIYLRPLLIPFLLFVTTLVGAICYFTLGPDRIRAHLGAFWDWLVRTRPHRAEKLRQVADRFALRFDAILDRLPDSWAEKLALPDLSQSAGGSNVLDDHPDPFERLKKLPDVYRG